MNFQEAAAAHREWNTKLRMYINGSGELKADIVQKDNACALGTWIHGEGSKNASLKEYEDLKQCHAEFHKIAADVVRLVDANQIDKAKAMIDAGGKFRELSMKIMGLLGNMEKKAAA